MEIQDLVTIAPWTLIAQICNLFIQMFLIKKFLFKPINEIIQKRQKMVEDELSSARDANAKANELKDEYEQNISSAKDQAEEIIKNANNLASNKYDEIVQSASKEASRIHSQAQRDIEIEKKKAIDDLKSDIGDIAVSIAEKVIEREVNEADHQKLIDDFIKEVGE